jgi:hypothetical protein
MDKAERELRSELREEVGFERNTVWRDMVAMERRTGAVVMQVWRGRGPCSARAAPAAAPSGSGARPGACGRALRARLVGAWWF